MTIGQTTVVLIGQVAPLYPAIQRRFGNVQKYDNVGYFSVSAEGIYSGAVPSSQDFVGTQGILRDITEKKTLEGRLEPAQKMEAVGNLASGIAHDLNNILSGLVSYPELLLLDLPENSPLRQKVLAINNPGNVRLPWCRIC